jgi:pimeloyl-ACP methyl ester carboxylesterase
MSAVVRPFRIHVPDADLEDLRERLARTRWPDAVEGAGWDYGTDLDYLRELVEYWRTSFDWRRFEREVNALPQYVARVGDFDVHFLHFRGSAPNALPLVVTHGWPSSPFEMRGLAARLADGDAPFDVVVPAMPGFGFSSRPTRRGFVRVDDLWRELMTEVLGYPRFVAHGVDVGARVTSALGRFHGDVVTAIHLGSVDLDGPEPPPPDAELSEAERDYLARVRRWDREEGGYAAIQGTRPQTLAYALHDSPVGLAAWIVEKFRAWSDCGGDVESRFSKDELLANVTLYWLTETMNASMRRYYEVRRRPADPSRAWKRVEVSTGIAMFPGEKDLLVPREWAERGYNVTRWTDMPRGGHFPALEEPALLERDLREFFRRG